MTNITFRTQLLEGVTDFCTECGLPFATTEVLVDLVVRLVRYQEEGVSLAPQVYLTDDIDFLISMLPEGEKVTLGSTTPDVHGIESMLKVCAPLAIGEWRIFGNQQESGFRYGVFRGSSNPTAVEVDEVLLTPQESVSVIKAHQVAEACVEIVSSKGYQHHIFFNHRKESSSPPLLYVDNLVQSITKKIDSREKESVESFLKKLLMSALPKAHGSILAVTGMSTMPKFLSADGVILDNPVDFAGLIKKLKNEEIAPDVIERKAELVRGMFSSDGIIVFDEHGRLLAYRCFVRVSNQSGVIGGARRRAFVTLKKHLGRGLSAAFIQSQDGWTEFESVTDE